MQNIRLFSTQIEALGQAKTPIVYYIKNFPKPMFVGTDFGETCNIVIDEEVGSAGIKPQEFLLEHQNHLDRRLLQDGQFS